MPIFDAHQGASIAEEEQNNLCTGWPVQEMVVGFCLHSRALKVTHEWSDHGGRDGFQQQRLALIKADAVVSLPNVQSVSSRNQC